LTGHVAYAYDLFADVFGYNDLDNSHSIGLPAASRDKNPNSAIKLSLESSEGGMILKRGN
jgi:hypothetical protein